MNGRHRYDQDKQPLSFDETTLSKSPPVFPSRHLESTTADERVSFSLVKELDDDKDEIVYSSASNIINNSDDEDEDDDDDNDNDNDDNESSHATDDNITNSSSEKATDEEGEVDNETDNEQEGNNQVDDDAVNELEKSKSSSIAELTKQIHGKNTFVQQKQYLSIDSGHIQSESSSPVDLSPVSSTSPSNQQVHTATRADPITFSYFRAPCPICRGSTYDESITVEIGKQYYHKACLHCCSCDKILRENEYNFHDISPDGRLNFYCTLHFCKSRLKQVTATLAVVTQQDLKPKPQIQSNTHWDTNLRLYPSLNDALSTKPHPLNVVNISDDKKTRYEQFQSSSILTNNNDKSSSTVIRSKTFNESLLTGRNDNNDEISSSTKPSTDNSAKHRYKRREQNRRLSPPLLTNNDTPPNQHETNLSSIITRKKKKILVPKSNSNLSSSSSQSLDDDRQRTSNERRRQREERQKELVRFRRSQEIQRELEEIEQKRLELDKRHTAARENLGSPLTDPTKKSDWERECLRIVRERTALQREEDELLIKKHALTLENERARAENEYRQLINLPDEQKTIKDKEREEQLITMIAKLVEAKNNLTVELDQMRLREMQEDDCLHKAFQLHGIEQRTKTFQIFDTLNDIV